MPHEPKPSAPSAADATAQPLDPMSVEGIFVEALSKEAGPARNGLLDMACQGNAELRMRVEALLRAYSDAGSFLNQPAGDWRNPPFTTAPAAPTDEHGIPSGLLRPSDEPGVLGTVGPYRVRELIGRGGMGIVLRAFDAKLNRIVAVKVLAPELAAQPTARRRFLREAQAAAAVSHPHVVTIHAVDEDEWPYLVMECIEGQSLQDKIERSGTLKLAEVLRIGTQIAEGLAAAHKQGLIHRDVKPANILLENGVERVKITDFGLARAADDVTITRPGEISGTPQYMSPEQASGERVDQRSDLFSLGCVLYAMCAGQPPFRADSIAAMVKKICDSTPQPLHEIDPQIPDWLAAAIDRLLAKDPNQRLQTAAEVAQVLGDALARFQAGQVVAAPAKKAVVKPRQLQPKELLPAWSMIMLTGLIGYWNGRIMPWHLLGVHDLEGWLISSLVVFLPTMLLCVPHLGAISSTLGAVFVAVAAGAFMVANAFGYDQMMRHRYHFQGAEWITVLATALVLLAIWRHRRLARAAAAVSPWTLAGWLVVTLLVGVIVLPVLLFVGIMTARYQRSQGQRLSPPQVHAGNTGEALNPGLPFTSPSVIHKFGPDSGPTSRDAKWIGDELLEVRATEPGTVRLFQWDFEPIDASIITYRFHAEAIQLKSAAYAEMLCRVNGQEYASRGVERKLRGSDRGVEIETQFLLSNGELADRVNLNVVFEGPGKIRMSDIQVFVTPLPGRMGGPRTTVATVPPSGTVPGFGAVPERALPPGGLGFPTSPAPTVVASDLSNMAKPQAAAGPPTVFRKLGPDDEPVSEGAKWIGNELEAATSYPRSMRLFEVPLEKLDKAIVTYRFSIKADELDSNAYAEMLCRYSFSGEYEGHRVVAEADSRGLGPKLKGKGDWLTVEIPAYFQKDQFVDSAKLRIVFEGPGKVRMKDIQVLITRLDADGDEKAAEPDAAAPRASPPSDTSSARRPRDANIVWGEPVRDVQLGWRIEPKKETYRVGELITVSLFLRNIGGQPIETTMPRTQILEKLGLDLGLHDSNEMKLPWRWSGAHKRGDEISGGFGITSRPNETFALPPFMLKIGSSPLGNFETIMAELLVPEDTAETLVPDALPLSLIFKLSSIGHARGDEAELESEPFQFSVADDNGAP